MAKKSRGGARRTVAKMDIFRDVQCGLELVFGGGGIESQNRDILSWGTFISPVAWWWLCSAADTQPFSNKEFHFGIICLILYT